MQTTSTRLSGALAVLAIAAFLGLAGCGGGSSSSSSGGDANFTGSGYPGVDTSNSRFVGGPIDRASSPSLEVAWKLPFSAESTYGAYSSTPIVSKGVIYSQDLASNVQAIDLESGEVLWTKRYEELDQGPNGIVVQEGKVFGATSSEAFALDQKTGKEIWSTKLTRSGREGIDMAPGYHGGLVYVSTVPTIANSEYPAGGVGVLWALDATTGKKVWHFNTVPDSLWGNPQVNAGGGLWYAPSFDDKGSMYFGTGNPVPYPGVAGDPWGASRPGPNPYTDSLVKLDAKTGKLQWFYQQTPHDIFDWDFQDPPVLTSAGGRELAIGAGKSGVVVALDAETGEPVWKRPVGAHNGHDEDGLKAMRGGKLPSKMSVSPGTLGGVISPMAANKTTLFVPVVNHAVEFSASGETNENGPLTGEMVAIDIKTGAVEWNQEFEAATFGPPTAVNDMVFFTTFDGLVHGLDAKTGGEVWQGSLPAASNTGVMVNGDTLLVPAGLPVAEGQKPALVAYRLSGK
ncbi:MAG: PQQ-binding-like beta-propeller repeat protein [Solirubrobacterales bacterium]|nr:PQQ-binding-like beta-propeller repeat protein [Solirubrobacterales bacterium]